MRRMYSEQELTQVINEVIAGKIEAGAFDEEIADAVDDYLTEHPVDPTAITGLDIAPKDVTASGNITGASIIENMGVAYYYVPTDVSSYGTKVIKYAGAVKNGNKITFVVFVSYTPTEAHGRISLGQFSIPNAVGNKLIPYTFVGSSNVVDGKNIGGLLSGGTIVDVLGLVLKNSTSNIEFFIYDTPLTLNTEYLLRYEVTFLLSDSLAS